MKITFDQKTAIDLMERIDDLVAARVEHALANRHCHEFPSSESEISDAQDALVDFLKGGDE